LGNGCARPESKKQWWWRHLKFIFHLEALKKVTSTVFFYELMFSNPRSQMI
jgi:hypothetical protein